MSGLELEHASWARRVVALLIDWVASSLVTLAIVGSEHYSDRSANWLTLAIFLLESAFGTALAGGSFGQLMIRIRVFRTDGRQLHLLMALFRSFLICLVVPPLVFKPDDGRGLHDLWTGSAAYRI